MRQTTKEEVEAPILTDSPIMDRSEEEAL